MSIAIITTDGEIIVPTNEQRHEIEKQEGIEWLQKQVAGPSQQRGWIEIVRLSRAAPKTQGAVQMICNEEGLLIGLPVNHIATMLYTAACQCQNDTPITGNVVLLSGGDTLD